MLYDPIVLACASFSRVVVASGTGFTCHIKVPTSQGLVSFQYVQAGGDIYLAEWVRNVYQATLNAVSSAGRSFDTRNASSLDYFEAFLQVARFLESDTAGMAVEYDPAKDLVRAGYYSS